MSLYGLLEMERLNRRPCSTAFGAHKTRLFGIYLALDRPYEPNQQLGKFP